MGHHYSEEKNKKSCQENFQCTGRMHFKDVLLKIFQINFFLISSNKDL
jgi:hypothetical protein